jgi:hypothetical protein
MNVNERVVVGNVSVKERDCVCVCVKEEECVCACKRERVCEGSR